MSTGPLLSISFARHGQSLERTWRTPSGDFTTRVNGLTPTDDELGDWWMAYLHGERPAPASGLRGELRTAEMFCGPGGLAMGFRQGCAELELGTSAMGAIDADGGAVDVYRVNHSPEVATHGSVTDLVDDKIVDRGGRKSFLYTPEIIDEEWSRLVGRVDAVLAGPPCQGHSNLNNKTRRDDPRNALYLKVPAVAAALGARIVIIENVPSVVNDRKGVVDDAIDLLEFCGYKVEPGVLHAAKLGWAQSRSRFFLVARRDLPPLPLDQVVNALSDEPRSVWWAIQELSQRKGDKSPMTRLADLSEENQRRIEWLFKNGKHELANSERPDCHKDGTTYTAVYGRMYRNKPAPTLTTGFMTPGRGRFIHPTQKRTLTPLEAARLQGFPDTYNFQADPSVEPTKAQLGKWIGDAVPMPLGFAAAISALAPGWP